MTGSRSWASRGSRRGRFQALLAAAGSFLLDPSDAPDLHGPVEPKDGRRLRDDRSPDRQVVRGARPLIAVFGLAGGCGSTVVARAVAAELAARDPSGTAAVACESRVGGVPLATKAASRLARALEDLPGGTRAFGRLCLLQGADPGSLGDALRGLAPLVINAGSSSLGGVPACIADRTLIVTTPSIEPTLARVAIECVARVGPEPTLVINRARHADGLITVGEGDPVSRAQIGGPGAAHDYAGPAVALPESRFGALLALGGREARGGLGRAIAGLVDGWEGGV
jgi:hypothetical protein